jgi:hypothetical protein
VRDEQIQEAAEPPVSRASESPLAGRYRKRPVEIEAMQYPGLRELADARRVFEWLDAHGAEHSHGDGGMLIHTLEGMMLARPGDWIIRGVKGEFYPCKPDIFDATYEPAA